MINIVLGIQTCTSMFGCPFCESYKIDAKGKPTNKRGAYVENAPLRTINNIIAHNEEYLKHGNNDRSNLKVYKNCEFQPELRIDLSLWTIPQTHFMWSSLVLQLML